MKRILLAAAFLWGFGFGLTAQNYKWKAQINYPIAFDQNFFGETYTGFLDFGISYHFLEYEYLSVGGSFNFGIFSNNDNFDITSVTGYKAIAYSLQPKINVTGTIPGLELVHPYIGLGYSFFMFDISGVNQGIGIIEDGDTISGFTINGGLYVDLSSRVFLNLEYDFSRIPRENVVPDTRFFKNINLIKLGGGYRF
jgi:opacity protein-like surface antigen